MNRATLLLAIGLTACGPENGWQGTGVGNPGSQRALDETRMSIGGEDGLEFTRATVGVAQWVLEDCDGKEAFLDVGREVDLLDSEVFPLPPGEWCAGRVVLDSNLRIEGTYQAILWPNPGAVDVTLHVTELHIAGPIALDGDKLVLEVGHLGWLQLSNLGVLTGGNLNVSPGGLGHGLYADRAAEGSGWFHDPNGNGKVDGGERLNGPFANGPVWSDGSDDDFF